MTIARPPAIPTRLRAFTLIELLVVIAIIALLLGLVGAAFTGVLGTARRASTENLLRNIQTAIQQFENDFSYLPPLIDGHKHSIDALEGPEFSDELRDHRYSSVYTLPLYLIGVGELSPDIDGMDPHRHDGQQGPGFRDPGPDRSWGGARDRANHRPIRTGRIYGPYLDIGDGTDVLRRARRSDFENEEGEFIMPPDAEMDDFFPAEYDFSDPFGDPVTDLFILVDRWDKPIRYYRHWPTRQTVMNAPRPSLDLVPVELRRHDSLVQRIASPLMGEIKSDPMLDQELIRAPYALLSAGPDADFGDTDEEGVWIEVEEDFFENASPADSEKISVIDRIKDNIRTTP